MEVLEHKFLHKRPDVFKVYPIGDIHAGSLHCAENDIRRKVDEIKNTKNAYWIGMGDMCDCIFKDDKRFDIGGLASWVKKDNIAESQRRWVRDLFKPIASKCLAFHEGNHEWMIHKYYQMDMTRNLCDDLGLPYGGYSSFVALKFARKTEDSDYHGAVRQYVFHCWHGAGSAQTEGARVMRLMRLVNEVQADIYLMGHLHCVATYTPDRLSYSNGRVKSHNLIAVITGSWHKTYTQPKQGEEMNASYSEQAGYKPSRIGCPVLYLNPDKDIVKVES